MLNRAQRIALFLTSSLVLLFYVSLLQTPFSLAPPCLPFQPLTSLSQLPELAKGRQCGHVATLNALYRWELNPIDENYDTEPSRVEEEGGALVFPGPLQKKLSRWLNGDPDLLQEAELQKVVQVKVETQIHEIT